MVHQPPRAPLEFDGRPRRARAVAQRPGSQISTAAVYQVQYGVFSSGDGEAPGSVNVASKLLPRSPATRAHTVILSISCKMVQ